MIRALNTAASGMTAQQLNLDSIAHNLANSSTAGFKERKAQFQDLIYQSMVQPGASAGQQTTTPVGLQIGLGIRTVSNEVIFSQGNITQTDNNLDLANQGKGLFQLRMPNGELAYTRAVYFQPDRNGVMVTAEGDPL